MQWYFHEGPRFGYALKKQRYYWSGMNNSTRMFRICNNDKKLYSLFFFETLWDFAVILKVAKILLWLYQKNYFGQKCRNNNSLVN